MSKTRFFYKLNLFIRGYGKMERIRFTKITWLSNLFIEDQMLLYRFYPSFMLLRLHFQIELKFTIVKHFIKTTTPTKFIKNVKSNDGD